MHGVAYHSWVAPGLHPDSKPASKLWGGGHSLAYTQWPHRLDPRLAYPTRDLTAAAVAELSTGCISASLKTRAHPPSACLTHPLPAWPPGQPQSHMI